MIVLTNHVHSINISAQCQRATLTSTENMLAYQMKVTSRKPCHMCHVWLVSCLDLLSGHMLSKMFCLSSSMKLDWNALSDSSIYVFLEGYVFALFSELVYIVFKIVVFDSYFLNIMILFVGEFDEMLLLFHIICFILECWVRSI